MSFSQLLNLQSFTDGRGQLISLESMKNVPFDIKRVYYITEPNSQHPRGFHAHRQLKQLAVCLSGSCRFVLHNGYESEEVWLNSPTKGLVINQMIWREMYDFSNHCILMVLASELYAEDDYIRDFQQFYNEIHNG